MTLEALASRTGTITAARIGRGRDLVILHSLLTDRHAFDTVLPALSAQCRVTLVNLPGFHGSAPVGGRMERYTEFVAQALCEFGVQEAILLGNGFGGTLALAFALSGARPLRKLILCDVAAYFPPEGKEAFRLMAQKVAAEGLGSIAGIAANRVFHPAYLAAHPHAADARKAVLMAIDPTAFRDACAVLLDADLRPGLGGLNVPCLVIYGEHDQATSPQLNRAIASAIPGAREIEIKDCGHCPPLENPEAFLRATAGFLVD